MMYHHTPPDCSGASPDASSPVRGSTPRIQPEPRTSSAHPSRVSGFFRLAGENCPLGALRTRNPPNRPSWSSEAEEGKGSDPSGTEAPATDDLVFETLSLSSDTAPTRIRSTKRQR